MVRLQDLAKSEQTHIAALAKNVIDERRLLQSVLRPWTPQEFAAVWPCRHALLADDPSWLAPFIKNLLGVGKDAELPSQWEIRPVADDALLLLQEAKRHQVDPTLSSNLWRAAFVVVKVFLSGFQDGQEHGQRLMGAALDLLRPCPTEELEYLLDQLVDAALGRHAEQHTFGMQVRALLFEKAHADIFFAARVLLSFRAHGVPRINEREFMASLTSESDECLLFRMVTHIDTLVSGDFQNCTKLQHCKPFPLLTHRGRFSPGLATADSRNAGGATGAQILKYSIREEASPTIADYSESPCAVNVIMKQESTGNLMFESGVANLLGELERLVMESPDVQQLLENCGLTEEDVRVTYRVVSLSSEVAVLEMVPNAVDLERARTRPRGPREPGGLRTLHEYLRDVSSGDEHGQTLEKALKILAFTSAKSSILSFVPHLGDRHGGNVLLTNGGRYVQIDYGYVLGYEPLTQRGYELLRGSPPIRVDYQEIFAAVGPQMMDDVFWKAVEFSYMALRPHIHLIQECMIDVVRKVRRDSGMPDTVWAPLFSPDVSSAGLAAEHLCQRLMPGLNDQQASRFIEHVLLHFKDDTIIQLQDHVRRTRDSLSASTMKMTTDLLQRLQEKWQQLRCSCCLRTELLGFKTIHCPRCDQRFCIEHARTHSCRC